MALGIRVLVGSYGSTISRPVAELSARRGLFFWETGAVGELGMETTESDYVFRFAPTGAALGRAAVVFVRDQLTPRLAHPRPLRYSVAYVNDVYGRAVAIGATTAILEFQLPMASRLPYDLKDVNFEVLAQRIAAARTEVLVVAAYLDDGVKLRRALVRAKVPLVVNIGTSSSYCMPAFGQALGADAVGVFASDKPDGDVLRSDRLAPEAANALQWARSEYRRRFREPMSAPALAGFAGGWGLFHYVFPQSTDLAPASLARAARAARLPIGNLPNGSGLTFASPGGPDGGANLLASSVIWEWVKPSTRAIVWPETFATHAIVFP
jgi:ABC-type branched-subunit amino acid transport system substrate-binding protein